MTAALLHAVILVSFLKIDPFRAESTEELAKQLNNPVAALISVPFQNNFDFGGGYNDRGFRYQLNFQPVIPISLSKDWNLISRTVLPFIQQDGYIPSVQKDGSLRSTSQTGLGDLLQSFFLSPKEPLPGGFIVGAGRMSLYFAPASRNKACRIASTLTIGMPQIAALTARRCNVRSAS